MSNAITSKDRTNLSAGDYTVTVTDENDCEFVETFTITQPNSLFSTATISDVKCFGENDGGIILNVNGGRAPFEFSWSNGSDIRNISGLTIGTYTVTVTDFYDCIAIDSFSILFNVKWSCLRMSARCFLTTSWCDYCLYTIWGIFFFIK